MNRILQVALFVCWPVIACILLFSVGFMLVAAWLLIPFGKPVSGNDGKWTLDFPWSKS